MINCPRLLGQYPLGQTSIHNFFQKVTKTIKIQIFLLTMAQYLIRHGSLSFAR
jgi:hypothetical protein